jgi:acyl dehydratase
LLNALVAEDLPGPGSVFLSVKWDFRAPARPGDVITAHGEVISTHPTKPICTMRTWITNQHGVVVVEGTAVVYREPLVSRRRDSQPESSRRHAN